jgi:hypothetical protein
MRMQLVARMVVAHAGGLRRSHKQTRLVSLKPGCDTGNTVSPWVHAVRRQTPGSVSERLQA